MQINLKKENEKLKLEIIELKKQVVEEVEYNRQNDKVLFQQNRMATMGEMIGNIAHQWRQPLMELSSIYMTMQAKIELLGSISNKDILESIEKSNKLTSFMSHTIDDFRNFFNKDKEEKSFRISKQVSLAVSMINSTLLHHKIKLEIIVHKNPTINGYKNEYAQVLLNILTNAKDVLISRKVKSGKIILTIDEKDGYSLVKISDNAGGIEVEPIQTIFEPFFTYEKKDGTGIGLFMSKLIIENNMNGRLFVENSTNGVSFSIKVPLKKLDGN